MPKFTIAFTTDQKICRKDKWSPHQYIYFNGEDWYTEMGDKCGRSLLIGLFTEDDWITWQPPLMELKHPIPKVKIGDIIWVKTSKANKIKPAIVIELIGSMNSSTPSTYVEAQLFGQSFNDNVRLPYFKDVGPDDWSWSFPE